LFAIFLSEFDAGKLTKMKNNIAIRRLMRMQISARQASRQAEQDTLNATVTGQTLIE